MNFVKFYGDQILGSSLMDEDVATRWLFFTLVVEASRSEPTNVARVQTAKVAARLANITEEQARVGLEALSSPDPESTTKAEGGRRIVRVEGGWRIVNAEKYRELRTSKQVANAERQRKWRESHGVTNNKRNACETEVSISHSAVVSVEGGTGGEAYDRAEKALRDERRSLECRMGEALSKLAEHPNSRLMVPAWCKKVTSYRKGEKAVGGVMDFRGRLSLERLEKSIEDAAWWLGQLEGGRVVDA